MGAYELTIITLVINDTKVVQGLYLLTKCMVHVVHYIVWHVPLHVHMNTV